MTKKTSQISKETQLGSRDPRMIIEYPRVTEKASLASAKGAYTFNVDTRATKIEIKKAIETLYGKVPRKINIVTIKEKVVFRRGKLGTKKGGKKAVVYLKKGDTITSF